MDESSTAIPSAHKTAKPSTFLFEVEFCKRTSPNLHFSQILRYTGQLPPTATAAAATDFSIGVHSNNSRLYRLIRTLYTKFGSLTTQH